MEFSSKNTNFSKLRIIKNLTVISISFLLMFTAFSGLSMLQTTMNKKEGVGTASQAVLYLSFAISSLLFSTYAVKKLGTKNAQLVGMILYLPYVAANFYPSWITLVPSAVLIGFGTTLLWGAQGTYFNECSVLYRDLTDSSTNSVPIPHKEGTKELSGKDLMEKVERCRNSQENCGNSLKISTSPVLTCKEEIKELSAKDFLQKAKRNLNSQGNCEKSLKISQPIHLLSYIRSEPGIEAESNQIYSVRTFKKETGVVQGLENSNRKKITEHKSSEDIQAIKEKEPETFELEGTSKIESNPTQKSKSLSSVNSLFFGLHGLALCSAQVWSNLISFYVLASGRVESYNKTSNCTCGVNFCNTDLVCVATKIEEVPADIRQYYTGVCFACGVLAVILIWMFVDHMEKYKKRVSLSWDHILATMKFIRNKEQIFIIPLTIYITMLQAFYVADFTKSYIACSWSISDIGLVSVFNGVTSSLSSFISGLLSRQFGRKIVLIFGQIINIVCLVLLYLWTPDAQQPIIFYLAGGGFGFISGALQFQMKALYGVFFQGEEETAFSSCSLYSSIGWALPFVYSEFFCTSIKLYIMFTIACLGFIGYLLAERSFSVRKKQSGTLK